MPAAYDPYRDIRRQEAERERARKAAERARKAAEAERKAAHQDARKDEEARINSDLAQRVEQLNSFLIAGLPATAEPNLSELHVFASAPLLDLGDLGRALPEPRWEDFAPPPPSFWRRNFSKAALADEEQRRRIAFNAARLDHAVRESARQREVDQQIRQHEAEFMRSKEAAERTNAEIDDLTQRFSTREKSAVESIAHLSSP